MRLTAISLFESTKGKFLMNATQNMCKNLVSKIFELRRPKLVEQPLVCSNKRDENFL